jgi:hypothetical protein
MLVVCMHITSFNIFVFLVLYLFEYYNCSVNNYNFFAMLEIVFLFMCKILHVPYINILFQK